MSDIFIARQPIFGQNMQLYGYELLYRKSSNNFYEGVDDDQATATLIDDLFFMEFSDLTEGTYGFINFSANLILDEIPLMLPKENLIIEILERVDVNQDVLDMSKKLKNLGYTIALDDFIFDNKNSLYQELIEIADIIKVNFSADSLAQQVQLINKYRGKIKFLAEKVETQEEYILAQNMGYTLFQGYFFSRPVMVNAKSIGSLSNNLMEILNEIYAPEPDFDFIAAKFETDLELSYKLLKLVNSVYYGVKYSIDSIHHALVQLGPNELIKWINIMLIKDIQNPENKELIKRSLVRGKMLSLLADMVKKNKFDSDYFLVGLFSSIDKLLNQNMEKVVSGLPLKANIKEALTGKENEMKEALDAIENFETLDYSIVENYLHAIKLSKKKFMDIYLESLKWQKNTVSF